MSESSPVVLMSSLGANRCHGSSATIVSAEYLEMSADPSTVAGGLFCCSISLTRSLIIHSFSSADTIEQAIFVHPGSGIMFLLSVLFINLARPVVSTLVPASGTRCQARVWQVLYQLSRLSECLTSKSSERPRHQQVSSSTVVVIIPGEVLF